MTIHENAVDKYLNNWYRIDPESYLISWEPDIYGEVMLMDLFKRDPWLFTMITGMESLAELSEVSGTGLRELKKRDVLKKKYKLLCKSCINYYPNIQELRGRVCPVCHAGLLERVESKDIVEAGLY